MMAAAASVVDPVTDTNFSELKSLYEQFTEQLPDFVKNADLAPTLHPEDQPRHVFADSHGGRYPCHTAAATLYSAMYFHAKKAELPASQREMIQANLEDSVEYFRVRGDYDAIVKRAAELETENGPVLSDSDFAYLWQGPNGVERHLPMRSTAEVKAAADWLFKYQDKLPYADRHSVATRIVEKAAHLNATFDEPMEIFIEQQAGRGCCHPDEVFEAVRQRQKLARANHPELAQVLTELAGNLEANPGTYLNLEMLPKLATTLEDVDRTLEVRYGDTIQRPEQVLFSATFAKTARDSAKLCALTTGSVYEKGQFEKLSRDDLKSVFGDEFVTQVCDGFTVNTEKMAVLAATLPRPDAELLEALLAEVSQQPVTQKLAADEKPMLSADEALSLADLYEAATAS